MPVNTQSQGTEEEHPVVVAARIAGEQAQKAIAKDVALQQDITDNIVALSVSGTEAGGRLAEATDAIERQKDIAALEAQNATYEASQAQGGRKMTKLLMGDRGVILEDVRDYLKERNVVDDEYKGDNSILGAIAYSFKTMGLDAREQALKQRMGVVDTAIQNTSANVESVKKEELATAKNMTEATLEQLSAQRAANASLAADKIQLESLAANSTQIARNIQATDAERRAAIANYDMYDTEENRKQRNVQHEFQMKQWKSQEARSKATFEQNMKQWREWGSDQATAARNIRSKQIIEDDTAYTEQASAAIVGQKLAGQAPFTLETAKGILRTGRPKERDMLYRWMAAGLKGKFGDSPEESRRFLASVINEGNAPTGPAVQHIYAIQREMGNVVHDPGSDAYSRVFANTAAKVVDGWTKNIKQGDTSNPYHAKPASVILNFPDLRELPTVKEVLGPLGMKEWNVQRVAEEIADAVHKGTVSIEQANADYNKIYRAITEHNSEVEVFDRSGLPRQRTYFAELEVPVLISESPFLQPAEQTVFGGLQKMLTQDSAVIDHLDPTVSMQWLIKLRVQAARNETRQANLDAAMADAEGEK